MTDLVDRMNDWAGKRTDEDARLVRGWADEVEKLQARVEELRVEIVATREVCSLVRRQDYFEVPTPLLVEAQIQHAEWRALTDAAEAVSERRQPVDNVLRNYRTPSLIQSSEA